MLQSLNTLMFAEGLERRGQEVRRGDVVTSVTTNANEIGRHTLHPHG